MEIKKVSFSKQQPGDFYATVKNRVQQYFKEKGITEYGDWRMFLKSFILLGTYFGAYLLLFTGLLNIWGMLGVAVLLGICTAGLGFSVAHDAIHGSYSKSDFLNYSLGLVMNLIGGNRYVWSITHNIIHHTYTNIHEFDEDIEIAPAFVRLSKHQKYNPLHRVQQYSAFMLYGFASLFWVMAKDFKKMFQKDIGPYIDKKHPTQEFILLFVTKAVYYTYTIVLPLIFLPITWWQFLIGYVVMHMVAGIILGIVFQLAHTVEDTDQTAVSDKGVIDNNWAIHQMETTSNFAMNSKVINWYVGGLNFQVEHHLFPRVCHVHYPAISKIVKQTAEEFNVPYHYHLTFGGAVKSHFKLLKSLSKPNQPIAA